MAVLDASAVLALLLEEPGSEVADDLVRLGIRIEPVTAEDATAQADIRARDRTATAGRPLLSLGDRACLALALRLGEPARTCDRSWTDLDLPVDVLYVGAEPDDVRNAVGRVNTADPMDVPEPEDLRAELDDRRARRA